MIVSIHLKKYEKLKIIVQTNCRTWYNEVVWQKLTIGRYSMKDPVLSIIIPCFNEEDHIVDIEKKVRESNVEKKEIIVVEE